MFELYEDIQDIRFVDTYLETKGIARDGAFGGRVEKDAETPARSRRDRSYIFIVLW